MDSTLLIIIAVVATLAWFFMVDKVKAKKLELAVIVLWLIVFVSIFSKPAELVVAELDWQSNYRAAYQDSREYLANTNYYDFDHSEVVNVASEIGGKAINAQNAVELTLNYVYENVEYDYTETDETCFETTAPKILQRKTGQCDTQSIAVISILRKMGIASRPVGGCIAERAVCTFKFALMAAVGKEVKKPKTRIIDLTLEEFGRGGALHAWVEAWLPSKGWVLLEPTTGEFADTNCWEYETELYPSNEDKYHLCVSDDRAFAQACARK